MNQYNPFQVLIDEHKIISSAKEIISSLKDLITQDTSDFERKMRTLIEFFREYSDKFHHHKEEEVLFGRFKNHPDFTLHDILDELIYHHENFRDMIKQIENALNDKDFGKSFTLLNNYIKDLEDHISIEDNELFPMGETLFKEKELEDIYFQFQDIDEALGIDRKKELEKIVT